VYISFLGSEGCDILKAYLEKRLASGESLSDDSPVIPYKSGYSDTGYLDGQAKELSPSAEPQGRDHRAR